MANLSSVAGFYATPSLVAYSATKFAVLGLSEALREELQPHGIGVTAICPGIINTPITSNSRDARRGAPRRARRSGSSTSTAGATTAPTASPGTSSRRSSATAAVAPISPEAWFSYGMKRVSPRLAGWTARRIDAAGRERATRQ